MAATYQVVYYTGSGPTENNWPAGGLFHLGDTTPTSPGSATAIPVPPSGNTWSWRKSLKLKVTATPVGSVANLRWFSDAVAVGTGITMLVKKITAYTQASAGDAAAALTSSSDAVTYTSASPLSVNAGTVLSNPSTGVGTQDYIEMQMQVASTAAAGVTAARTYSYRVDET